MINSATAYKPTFMQTLLGRHYKWWYVYIHTFKSNTINRLSLIGYFVSSLLFLASSLLVWSVSKNPDFTFSYILTYFIIGQVFMIEGELFYDVAGDISHGKISAKLLMPTNLFVRFIVHDLGWLTFTRFIIQPLIYIPLIIITNQLFIFPSLLNGFIFIAMSIISYLIYAFSSLLLGSIAFWAPDVWGIIDLSRTIKDFSSGRYFPLNISSITKFLYFTPFAFMFYHPMQIYLGKYDFNQTLMVFAGGVAWCFALYFLAKWVFKMGLKRNEAVGL